MTLDVLLLDVSQIATLDAIPTRPYSSVSTTPTEAELPRLSRHHSRGRYRVARHVMAMVVESRSSRVCFDAQPNRPTPNQADPSTRRPTTPGGPIPLTLYRAPGNFGPPLVGLQREQYAPVERQAAEVGGLIQPAPGVVACRDAGDLAPLRAGAARMVNWRASGAALSRRRDVDHGGALLGLLGPWQARELKAYELHLHGGGRFRAVVVVGRDGLDHFDGLQRRECRFVIAFSGGHPRGGQQVFGKSRPADVEQSTGLSSRFLDRGRRRFQQAGNLTRRATVAQHHFGVDRGGQCERLRSIPRASRPTRRITRFPRFERASAFGLGVVRHGKQHTSDTPQRYHGRIAAERPNR